jgi:imipenem/basic amino acid-specific outer membrane pore
MTFKLERLCRLASILSIILVQVTTVDAADVGKDGNLEAQFRTFYFDRDKADNVPSSTALSQALMLRYHSPYMNDVVNLNVSGFGNLKLSGEDGEGGTGLLDDEPDGKQSSYSKLAEIYAKFNLPNSGGIDIGRFQINTPLLNDSDNRATPSTTQAAFFNIRTSGPDFYGLMSDRGSAKTKDEFGEYTDTNGDSFNVYVVGIDHKFENSLYLHGAIGQADRVMQQIYLNAKYQTSINNDYTLLIDGYQYFGEADGQGALAGVGPDYSSDITSIAAQVSKGKAKFSLAYQKINGDGYQFSWDGNVHDDNDLKTWFVVQKMKFIHAEEESWQARIDYDFNDYLEGFSAMARYTSGDNIKRDDGSKGSEWENNIDLMYMPPAIENLSFNWRYSVVRSSETIDTDENRFIINWNIKGF